MSDPRHGDGESPHHAGDEHEPVPGRGAGFHATDSELLVFTAAALREVDRLAASRYGLPTLVLMENAGRELARATLDRMGAAAGARIAVVCGPGNNGGDGFTAARHLTNAGAEVLVLLSHPEPRTPDAAGQLKTLQAMGVPTADVAARPRELAERAVTTLGGVHAVVDCLLGTGVNRAPEGPVRELIEWVNHAHRHGVLVVAADVPSGMDADTGGHAGPVVTADVTVTFAGLKQGFLSLDAQGLLGDVIVADIGVPRELLDQLGQRLNRPAHLDWPVADEPRSIPRAAHRGAAD